MKSTTAMAKELDDAQLKAEGLRLRRQIPKDQALFDAIKREARRRAKSAKQKGATG